MVKTKKVCAACLAPGAWRQPATHRPGTGSAPVSPDCQLERSAARRQARADRKEQAMAGKQNEKTTVGELVTGMQRGTFTREAVAAAIKKLELIHWDAEVERPEAEIDHDHEMGASMADDKKPLTVEIGGGLTMEAPELSLADRIPGPGILTELPTILVALPGQVMEIAGQLPDMLGIPQLDHDHQMG